MASNVVYVHDLPFLPRQNLCRILDADGKWQDLGGIHMKYDVTTLTLIGQAIHRDKSPSWELLNKFSEKNGTTNHLYRMLAQMDHQRAMAILMPYVDSKYHCLLRNENTTSSFTVSSKKEGSYGTSQLSMSTSRHLSKFRQNFVNLDTQQTKMNSLNAQAKKSVEKFKGGSNNFKEESTSDNCIPEKMKGVKNSVRDEASKSGKKQSSLLASAVSSSDEECLPDIPRISYEDIKVATDGFNKDRILGRGGFGTVYRGEWKGTSVAIKRLTPRPSSTQGPSQQLVSMKQSLNELNILKTCRFDHILPLYAVSLDGENPCLIYQLMVNGSLEDRLLLKGHTAPLTWSQRSHIAECVTKGINYLHTLIPGKPLVHGDIKSANILLDANMEAKIGDFGLTREGPGCQDTHVKVSSVHGTECYLPDEYLRQKKLSPQVDIYSYGIVLLEIATGLRPFDAKRGKGSKLPKHVMLCGETGRLDSLRDVKAGEEKMIWFRELVRIGQTCSNIEKKKRPPMSQMLLEFERIKQEMSMMDIIRRLSSDKSSQLPSDLPPIGIQMYYDLQRQSGTANRLSPGSVNAPQESGVSAGPPVPSPPPEEACAPLPLLSILRRQVSEVESNASVEFDSRNNSDSATDYTTED